MSLTYFEYGHLPFPVPAEDASFASSVGPGTNYPAGFSLDALMQIYWRTHDYQLIAHGTDTDGEVSQDLTINDLLPPRNVLIAPGSYTVLTGFTPASIRSLAAGLGVNQLVPGSGTITFSGVDGSGTNPAALFNLQVNLFTPLTGSIVPVVFYDGLYWPLFALSCSVTNTVTFSGGTVAAPYACTTVPAAGDVTIGSFDFFGVSIPVYSPPLDPGGGGDPPETRTFTGSLTSATTWS